MVTNRYIIFDDDSDILEEQWDNFVNTSWDNGLTAENTMQARKIFKVKPFMPKKKFKHHHPIIDGEDWYDNLYRKHNSRRKL